MAVDNRRWVGRAPAYGEANARMPIERRRSFEHESGLK
jgi:hypothetical protein